MRLRIENFAQIESADINFGDEGDLTILVGQQATGKSLVLQWLKLLADRDKVREDWKRYGINWQVSGKPTRELDAFFGEGLGAGYDGRATQISLDGKKFTLSPRSRNRSTALESVYVIPAQRALLMADGWPRPFSSFPAGTPYVARAQSERLVQWLGNQQETLFPITRKFPEVLRNRFNDTIFHGARVEADRTSTQSRLLLKPDGKKAVHIPYMAWTAGQREFVPLMMALYRLLPSSAITRDPEIKTVVIEEPELGLHPNAVFAIGHAILQLMARGYRVAVSTHSPLMLDFAWTLRRLKTVYEQDGRNLKPWRIALDIGSKLALELTQKTVRTYYMSYQQNRLVSRSADISMLRTSSEDPAEAAWGLMLEDSNRMADTVAQMNLNFGSRH